MVVVEEESEVAEVENIDEPEVRFNGADELATEVKTGVTVVAVEATDSPAGLITVVEDDVALMPTFGSDLTPNEKTGGVAV